jgi:thioredoxin-dependent peroxiredoxin
MLCNRSKPRYDAIILRLYRNIIRWIAKIERPIILDIGSKDPFMTIQLGQTAPDFEQNSTAGRIHFHEWLGSSWGVLFSHPKNFTPVCTTELGEVARLRPEWDRRNVKVIGLSVDPVEAHHKWEKDIAETQGHVLDFPMIADADGKVSALYGMIHPESDPTLTVRSVFVIDPTRKVRLILTYPPSTGRNFGELLRAIDSLQLTDSRSIATPVNWEPGEPVVISPKLSDEEASRLFPQGFTTLKPYLRIVDLEKGAAHGQQSAR